jgi:hypothetical protein
MTGASGAPVQQSADCGVRVGGLWQVDTIGCAVWVLLRQSLQSMSAQERLDGYKRFYCRHATVTSINGL